MNICVYGASSSAIDKSYILDGEKLGELLAQRGHTLVFGGGNHGLMGAAARGAKKGGAKIIGVTPSFFNVDGILYPECDELLRTETMRERKQLMEDLSDAFIMTPGGIGTFEEFFEILTLSQLGRHTKPISVLNTNGYFNPLIEMMERAVKEEFMTEQTLSLFKVFENIEDAVVYVEQTVNEVQDLSVYKKIEN